jgi:hypothetical protein
MGLNEGVVATDHPKISLTYITKVNKITALNVSPNNVRILASYVSARPTVITLRKETNTSLQRSTTIFDTAWEEVSGVRRQKLSGDFSLQMQTSILFVLLFSSGAVSAGLENLLRLTEFIVDIYQKFPHSCFFIIDTEAQQGENKCFTMYNTSVYSLNRNVLTELWG